MRYIIYRFTLKIPGYTEIVSLHVYVQSITQHAAGLIPAVLQHEPI